MDKFFSKIICAFPLIILNTVPAFAQTPIEQNDFSNTLLGKIAIVVVSSFLSLLGGYVLLYLKEQRNIGSRISYTINVRQGILGVDEKISKYISIFYKEKKAENINYVQCELVNTGASLIKNQKIRFEFPSDCEVLDWNIEPAPPKELGFSESTEPDDQQNERRFDLEYFQTLQRVVLHFVVSCEGPAIPKLFGYNMNDEVRVVSETISKVSDDRRVVEIFFVISVLTIFIPNILNTFPFHEFRLIFLGPYYIVSTAAILYLLPKMSRIFSSFLMSFFRYASGEVSASSTSINIANSKVSIGEASTFFDARDK